MNVRLRQWQKTDVAALAVIANNKKIWDNVRDRLPYPYTEKDAREWLALATAEKVVTTFCVEADGELAGSIGITFEHDVYRNNVEIGYFVGEKWWGKGVATEAVRLMVEYVEKNFDVTRIYAGVFEYNKASMRVLEKNGFYLECIRKRGAIKNGKVINDHLWARQVGNIQ